MAAVAPKVFPESLVSMGHVAAYLEVAAVIISLTLLGKWLELKARSQTSAAVRSLLGLAPKTARRVHAHRRAAAGDQARGRQADRRHAQHQWRAGNAIQAGGLGDGAIADRAVCGKALALGDTAIMAQLDID
jgi:hypothetical protein